MSALAITTDVPEANVYLHPGQIYATAEPAFVSTVLGSCVAVCLFDEEARVAGINHFLLPSTPLRTTTDARYGNVAMQLLLDAVIARGAEPSRLVAKVFGGACVMGHLTGARQAIGGQNITAAREFLERSGIIAGTGQTGGTRGRKVVFQTSNGRVFVKEL